MTLSALRISLRDEFRSARPLIPDVERVWWGARIRPLPPYEDKDGGRRGRIQSPQEVVVEGSAGGRGGARTQEAKDTNRSETARTATATATARRGRKGRSSADKTEAERVSGKRRKQREIETSRCGGDTR